MRSLILLPVFLALQVAGEQVRYDGYQLWSVFVRDGEDVKFLMDFAGNYPDVDFWTDPAPQHNTTVNLPPAVQEWFALELDQRQMTYVIRVDDIQRMIEAASAPSPSNETEKLRRASGDIIDHYSYHNYAQITSYLLQLQRAYPLNVKVSSLSHFTYEKRPVLLVQLSGWTSSTRKPSIIIESNIHAREWISSAASLWIIEKLLRDYSSGEETARFLLDKYNWYFVPVTNPDGFEYSHTTARLWRKNRRYFSPLCSGIDLNRNFDAAFGTVGVSHSCESNIYCGPRAFSEAETKNIRELVYHLQDTLVAYVGVHSYSQLLLVPWFYSETDERPPNAQELDRVGHLMWSKLTGKYGTQYRYGSPIELLYYAPSGSSEDWALIKNPGIYAYAYELRPDPESDYGFVLPADQIVPTAEELFASLKVLGREIKV